MDMRCIRRVVCYAIFMAILAVAGTEAAETGPDNVPPYILDGFTTYENQGYEAAVAVWLKDSPFEKGTEMASRIQFFKNVEMLYGTYQSYNIVTVKETPSSQMTYVQIIYQRQTVYAKFLSFKKNKAWVLSNLHLSDRQELPAG